MYAPKQTIARARVLRRRLSPPEARLWTALRGRALDGLRFRRQHPLGPYVLDFYCEAARLCVEVDGHHHFVDGGPERDAVRDAWLAARGVRTLRLPAGLIRTDLDGALLTILAAARRSV